MIELKVSDYCQNNCPDFEANVITERREEPNMYNPLDYPILTSVQTLVTCKYRHRCAAIYKQAKNDIRRNR